MLNEVWVQSRFETKSCPPVIVGTCILLHDEGVLMKSKKGTERSAQTVQFSVPHRALSTGLPCVENIALATQPALVCWLRG